MFWIWKTTSICNGGAVTPCPLNWSCWKVSTAWKASCWTWTSACVWTSVIKWSFHVLVLTFSSCFIESLMLLIVPVGRGYEVYLLGMCWILEKLKNFKHCNKNFCPIWAAAGTLHEGNVFSTLWYWRISHILLCYMAEFLISFPFISIDLTSTGNGG